AYAWRTRAPTMRNRGRSRAAWYRAHHAWRLHRPAPAGRPRRRASSSSDPHSCPRRKHRSDRALRRGPRTWARARARSLRRRFECSWTPPCWHSAPVGAGFPEACDNGRMRDACAVVLAGGESRRFGSDKALAQFRGEPLIAHVLRGLASAGFAQIALAAKEPRRYAAVAAEIEYVSGGRVELLPDVRPFQTPLAGLA